MLQFTHLKRDLMLKNCNTQKNNLELRPEQINNQIK